MDTQSYKDSVTILKSTLQCKRKLPLEFFYKIEHQDELQCSDFIYSPLHSVAEFMGCFFNGFFKEFDSENLMIGLEMSTPEVRNSFLNVHWFVSVYDEAQDTFFCLGKSKFDFDNVKHARDRIYVSFKTINSFIQDKRLLLKWTVSILSFKDKSDTFEQCIKGKDVHGKLCVDSSLDSLLDILCGETDALGASKNKTRLKIVKKEIDDCRRQQFSNEENLQILASHFQKVDLRLDKLLDRISPQEPVVSVRRNVAIVSENKKIVSSVDGRIHGNDLLKLKRSKSEPLLCKRSFKVSFNDHVINCCDLKISKNGRVQIEKFAEDPVEIKDHCTQTNRDAKIVLDKSTNTEKSYIKKESLFSSISKKNHPTTSSDFTEKNPFKSDIEYKGLNPNSLFRIGAYVDSIRRVKRLYDNTDDVYIRKRSPVSDDRDIRRIELYESLQPQESEMKSLFDSYSKRTLNDWSIENSISHRREKLPTRFASDEKVAIDEIIDREENIRHKIITDVYDNSETLRRDDLAGVIETESYSTNSRFVSFKAQKDIDILLIGKTGSGKSRTGNTILQRHCFKYADSSTSVTHDVQHECVQYDNCRIKVVDCPGIENTGNIDDDEKASRYLIEKMGDAVTQHPDGYHAFLLVVRYGDRFTKEDKNVIKTLKSIFGEEIIRQFSILLMTYGDLFRIQNKTKKSFKRWCSEQTGILRDLMEECGNRVILFDNETEDQVKRDFQMKKLIKTVYHLQYNGMRYNHEYFQTVAKEEVKEPRKLEETSNECSNEFNQLDESQKNV